MRGCCKRGRRPLSQHPLTQGCRPVCEGCCERGAGLSHNTPCTHRSPTPLYNTPCERGVDPCVRGVVRGVPASVYNTPCNTGRRPLSQHPLYPQGSTTPGYNTPCTHRSSTPLTTPPTHTGRRPLCTTPPHTQVDDPSVQHPLYTQLSTCV